MKKRSLAALGLATCLAWVGLWLLGDAPWPPTPGLNVERSSPTDSGPREPLEAQIETATADPSVRRAEATSDSQYGQSSPIEDGPFRWRGRLVGADGAPAAGRLVALSTANVPFTAEYRVFRSTADFEQSLQSGLHTRTDDLGQFVLKGRPEDFEHGALYAQPGPEEVLIAFGLSDRDKGLTQLQRPHSGERDLGALAFLSAGRVRGRVVDSDGLGIEGVSVYAGDSGRPFWRSPIASISGPDGRFELQHVFPMFADLEASKPGCALTRLPATDVHANETVDLGDVELTCGLSIRGSVIDDMERPIPGAAIQAISLNGQSEGHAKSLENGSFEVFVTRDDPHHVRVSAVGFGSAKAHAGKQRYRPGEHAVVTLKEQTLLKFDVVDSETGAPLEELGVRIGYGMAGQETLASQLLGFPSARPRSEARLQWLATPGEDLVRVTAIGYESFSGPVELSSDDPPTMVIPLRRSGEDLWVVRGALANSGEPWAGAEVVLRYYREIELPANATQSRPIDPFNVAARRATVRKTRTDSEGRFRIPFPAEGVWRAFAATDAGIACSEYFRVVEGQDVDLGRLEVRPYASLTVVFRGSPALGNLGSTYGILYPPVEVGTLDADHRARWEGLAPGHYTVRYGGHMDGRLEISELEVELSHGDDERIEWDLTPHETQPVRLMLSLDGRPASERRVVLFDMDRPEELLWEGRSDAGGRVRGALPKNTRARCALAGLRDSLLRPNDAIVRPTFELQNVDFVSAAVRIRLPDDVPAGEGMLWSLEFESPALEQRITLMNAALNPQGVVRSIRRAQLPAGPYSLNLDLLRPPSAGGGAFEKVDGWNASFKFEAKLGETTELEWPSGDR